MVVVGYTDGAGYFISYFVAVFKRLFDKQRVVFAENPPANPDLLIYSVFGDRHKRYTCKKVLVSGEPTTTIGKLADLLLDCKDVVGLRSHDVPMAYLPFYVLSFEERWQNRPEDLLKTPDFATRTAPTKTKFCAFLYSKEVEFRNRLFDALSRQKQVDALGKARNVHKTRTDRGAYRPGHYSYNDLAVRHYRPYKFVIACENTRLPGYVTEKVVSAMLAGAIPIYLGAPDIAEHFNPRAMICVGDFANWHEACNYVMEVDQNEDLYRQILSEPWLPANRLTAWFDSLQVVGPALKTLLDSPGPPVSQPRRVQPGPVLSLKSAGARKRRLRLLNRAGLHATVHGRRLTK